MNKIKVAIVTERIYPFYTGGSEKVMYDYASILAEQYSVTVFTSLARNGIWKEQDNPKFVRVFPKVNSSNKRGNHSLMWIFLFSLSLLKYVRKILNFDLVILDSIHYFYPKILLKYLKMNNNRIGTVFYEAWYEYRKSNNFSALLSLEQGILINRLVRYSDAIFSISKPTTDSLINNYKVKNEKVFTIPLFIDYENVQNRFVLKPLTERHYDVVFVGRFAKIKKIDDLVSAIDIVRYHKADIKVALVGDGPNRDKIRKQINTLSLEENVKLFGYLDNEKKLDILNDSMIFVLPSEREGFSISTLESMALGCVPVVSRPPYEEIFGVSHFVKDRINGLYYNFNDISGLAQSIVFLIDHPNDLAQFSIKAHETAKLFDKETMRKNVFQTVERILS